VQKASKPRPPGSIRAITVRQPYASGLILQVKRVENRDFACKPPEWLAVHSSAKAEIEGADLVQTLRSKAGGTLPATDTLPLSAVLGFIHCSAVVGTEDDETRDDPQAVGPKCWIVDDVVALESPVTGVKGALGLWHWMPPAGLTLPTKIMDARAPPPTTADPQTGAGSSTGGDNAKLQHGSLRCTDGVSEQTKLMDLEVFGVTTAKLSNLVVDQGEGHQRWDTVGALLSAAGGGDGGISAGLKRIRGQLYRLDAADAASGGDLQTKRQATGETVLGRLVEGLQECCRKAQGGAAAGAANDDEQQLLDDNDSEAVEMNDSGGEDGDGEDGDGDGEGEEGDGEGGEGDGEGEDGDREEGDGEEGDGEEEEEGDADE